MTAFILSCGIPTSIPILPKEVVVKASPSVSVPLGRVNYNLYSGISGGSMEGKLGGLDNLLGDSWLQDLLDQGARIYDYRPAGQENDTTQKFLIHYKLDMEDTLGSASEFDMSEYKDMLDDLTNQKPMTIDNVSFEIPSVNMTQYINVKIPLDGVTEAIANSSALDAYPAYLPVKSGTEGYEFPDDISGLTVAPGLGNTPDIFLVSLKDMDSLTLEAGKLKFQFKLTYGPPLSQGKLELSGFTLRAKGESKSIDGVKQSSGSVPLDPYGGSNTGETSISFEPGTKLPKEFELVCHLEITGNTDGYFQLEITPSFEGLTISGVEGMVLTPDQKESLKDEFAPTEHAIDDPPGDSFRAVVKTGNLEIDKLFAPLNDPDPDYGGWNLEMDLSELYINQESVFDTVTNTNVEGLSLGGPSQPVSSDTNLKGETLNNKPVKISGSVTMVIADGEYGDKLTFKNFPITMNDPDASYEKQLDVILTVTLFSTVTALANDIGLKEEDTVHNIEQDLGDDFTSFKDWLNYVQFEEGGLGAILTIGTLNSAGGMALFVDAQEFGLNNVCQPLENLKDPAGESLEGAELNFTNEGVYRLLGKQLPDNGKLNITVKLGLEDPDAQQIYEDTKEIGGIMTITDVVPGKPIELLDMEARLVFDWTAMSVKPEPHESGGSNDPLPDYPFKGTYPDKSKGEEGIDLSDIPKGLGFYIPNEAAGDKAGEGINANLYISLKRQKQSIDGGEWVDDPDISGEEEQPSYGWEQNLQVNLPSLDFRARHGDNVSENLFTYNPNEEKSTGEWALFRSLDLEAQEFAEQGIVKKDEENKDNPFKIYSGPTLPESNKAIPIGNLAKVFNENLASEKDLYFDYTVELSRISKDDGSSEPGEILLYPDMLEKRIAVSVDLLIVVPLKFMAIQTDPDNPDAPVVITIDPDLGNDDLFGRKNPDDNEYFDLVKSFGFDINIKNLAGLSAGRFFLKTKTGGESNYYKTSMPIIDFSRSQNKFSLDSGELEKIKGIWPFIPQVSVEFEPGEVVRIERNFNIELQSITIKAGGEYTFETGL
jgi:hypothetical protein